MEEVRDTPVITVLERPEAPVFPDPRGLLRNGAIALVFGTVLGIFFAFAGEYLRRLGEDAPGDYAQFAHLRRESFRDVTRPWRAAARLVRRRNA